uniref:Uncharacterized protein n=1 Tax=Chelydra serpentina TaxID=8475 RepID=A0A8C3XNX5_CHESE
PRAAVRVGGRCQEGAVRGQGSRCFTTSSGEPCLCAGSWVVGRRYQLQGWLSLEKDLTPSGWLRLTAQGQKLPSLNAELVLGEAKTVPTEKMRVLTAQVILTPVLLCRRWMCSPPIHSSRPNGQPVRRGNHDSSPGRVGAGELTGGWITESPHRATAITTAGPQPHRHTTRSPTALHPPRLVRRAGGQWRGGPLLGHRQLSPLGAVGPFPLLAPVSEGLSHAGRSSPDGSRGAPSMGGLFGPCSW